MTDFADFLRLRRSIRFYQDREVPVEILREMIDDACHAPSSSNGQPWRFILINNREMIERISDECKKNLLRHIEKDPASPSTKYEAALRNARYNIFYNAPSLVYIVGPADIGSVHVDCALAASYFMFSAVDRGLGTCWIGLGRHVEDPEILHLVGVPDDCVIVAPIIVGFPKKIPAPSGRSTPKILKILS